MDDIDLELHNKHRINCPYKHCNDYDGVTSWDLFDHLRSHDLKESDILETAMCLIGELILRLETLELKEESDGQRE